MQGRRPTHPTKGGGVAAGGRADGLDVNRERLVFCVTSLVGHRVTAKLRNNVLYEGLFHSCSLDGDLSITLKWARRLPSKDTPQSGEMVQTMLIPGKDFLQVSAVNVPSPCISASDDASSPGAVAGKGFAVDGDIAARKQDGEGGDQRELVPWGDANAIPSGTGGLEDGSTTADPNWDQFATNRQLYGVTSTYSEELYTTKLDPTAVPKEQRDRADRIAREIERGNMRSEVEGTEDADEDEEGQFSSVNNGGAVQKSNAAEPAAKAQAAPGGSALVSQLPQTREMLNHEPFALADASGLTRDFRQTRRAGVVSEMKRINALNLEPTIPKLDDGSRNPRMNFKDTQARNARLSAGSGDLKMEFQESLKVIQNQAENKQRKAQAASNAEMQRNAQHQMAPMPSGQTGPGAPDQNWFQQQHAMMYGRKDGAGAPQGQSGGAGFPAGANEPGSRSKQFAFNPQARDFTPGAAVAGGASQSSPAVKSSNVPQFAIPKKNPDLSRKNLGDILEPFFQLAKGAALESSLPEWPDAKGNSSYREILGQPNPGPNPGQMASRPPPLAGVPGGGGPVPGPGWQQQPQAPDQGPPMGAMGPGGGPPMMQPGFVVTNAPAGFRPPGNPQQMYQPMYQAPGGNVGPQGPQGGSGGGMPPQGQQQPMFQQTMMAQQPSQSMAVPVSMMPAQGGQNGPGGMGVPKFGGQQQQMVAIMPMPVAMVNQYQQGFAPQQPVQGQPGQQGPPGPPGQQADGAPQGQMMQQQMYHRPAGT